MGKKYIVEIGRLERLYKAYVNGNGKPNITWLSPEVDLTPYTESDTEQVRNEAYQRGLNDAWEAARTLWNTPNRKKIFGYTTFSVTLTTLTAQEAIEKIRQYEQEEDGLRQNIQTIVDQCGYSLDEIAEVLAKMREESNG